MEMPSWDPTAIYNLEQLCIVEFPGSDDLQERRVAASSKRVPCKANGTAFGLSALRTIISLGLFSPGKSQRSRRYPPFYCGDGGNTTVASFCSDQDRPPGCGDSERDLLKAKLNFRW